MNNNKQPPGFSIKKLFLKIFSIFTEKYLCLSLFLIKLGTFRYATLLKRDSNAGVFCEYCKIFKKAYFEENLLTAASE